MEMSKKYEQIGVAMTCRSYQDYMDMFMLEEIDLKKGAILDVAAGASSFVQEVKRKGYPAIAVDPLYQLSSEKIREHGKQEIEESTNKIDKVKDLFHWEYYGTLQKHYENRLDSLQLFALDYERIQKEGNVQSGKCSLPNEDYFVDIHCGLLSLSQSYPLFKVSYVAAALPTLPFQQNMFSLILCSHFLFLYHEQFTYSFHLQALKEMIRICAPGGEIRIFPIVGFSGERYPLLEQLVSEIESDQVMVQVQETSFRFLRGSTHLLKISKLH